MLTVIWKTAQGTYRQFIKEQTWLPDLTTSPFVELGAVTRVAETTCHGDPEPHWTPIDQELETLFLPTIDIQAVEIRRMGIRT